MDSGYTVRAVRANNSEIGHSNLARRHFFHQADAFNATFVSWETDAHFVEKSAVDLVNDFQLPRKHQFKPSHRPFFKRFRQKSMVPVRQGLLREIPCLVPGKMSIVQQDAHQFSDRHRRMRVIELNRRFVGQFSPIRIVAQEATHQIGQGTCHQKVFLRETQLLPGSGGVIGIENPGQRLRFQSSSQRTYKIASTKFLKIEEIGSSRGPEAESVDRLASVAYNWTI